MASILAGRHDSPSPERNINPTGSSEYKIIDLTDTYEAPEIDVGERMRMLSMMLSNHLLSHQHKNIEAVMAMYKTGTTPTTSAPWWFVNGEFFKEQPELEKLPHGCIVFVEVCFLSHRVTC